MIHAKVEPGVTHMKKLAETMLDIVLHTQSDLACQTRWSVQLYRILRTHGKKINMEIQWKPLYLMLKDHHLVPSMKYEGAGVAEGRRRALVPLIHQCRRFFPLGAAEEIWNFFKPPLQKPQSPEAEESLGWLCMMLPTQEATKGSGDWDTWMKEWMHIWGSVHHNSSWQALWFSLIARFAKHDVHGVVHWHEYIPEMCNRFSWAINVPLGTASASMPFAGDIPGTLETLFAENLQSRSASMAKAIIYSIGREDVQGSGKNEDPAIICLETMVQLFEQYYHPSNGGQWSAGLAMFLRELCNHLCRRLVAEHSIVSYPEYTMDSSGESEEEDDDEEEDDEYDDDGSFGSEGDGVDSSVTDEDVAVGGVMNGEEINSELTCRLSKFPRRHIDENTRKRIVTIIMRLALKGQSCKESAMRRYSSIVLSMIANIEPHLVLPEVQRHFMTALETITAAKQYGNAIQTLSLCVRPLLIAGVPLSGRGNEIDGIEFSDKDNGVQCIAEALNATLPGIDANDPPKSLAVFRLYCCVLSCVGSLEVCLCILLLPLLALIIDIEMFL